MSSKKGKLYVVGVGPGNHDHMTYRAKQVIEESEVIIGYDTYVSLVEDLIADKEVYRYAMTQEVDRANQAIDFAEKGRIVSVVSSGDPGIYGMVGLIYEILAQKGWNRQDNSIYVECVPGVSSLNSCAALVGSPLMTDFAVVSMSDLLVPWDIIVKGAYRESQELVVTTLEKMLEHQDMLGMITTVIVGNSSTFNYEGMMINPRGYTSKYELIRQEQQPTK